MNTFYQPRNLICTICAEVITGFDHNPFPLCTIKGERCCDLCNWELIIPARLVMDKNGCIKGKKIIGMFNDGYYKGKQ